MPVSKGGIRFTPSFSTADVFEGDIEYSWKLQMLNILASNRIQHQGVIDAKFPSDQPKHSKTHVICYAILQQGYFQVMGLLESLLPFNKMMTSAGLAEQEAWKKCLTYCRAVFNRIHEVRMVSTDRTLGGMFYGMMQKTCLLESYGKLGWIRHPDVSSALVIASLQKEGKVIKTAMTKGK